MRWAAACLIPWLAACILPDDASHDRFVPKIDHLVFAVADLESGIEQIEAATGVRAQFGGAHPGRGTRNALMALGPEQYLEILAPDPDQPNPVPLESIGLSATRSSRMVSWALEEPRLERVIEKASAVGVPMLGPTPGERETPEGSQLTWRTASFSDPLFADGLAPFFIDWTGSEHPAESAPRGARLVTLRAEHPTPESARSVLDALGIPLRVDAGAEVALITVLDTPRGVVELR